MSLWSVLPLLRALLPDAGAAAPSLFTPLLERFAQLPRGLLFLLVLLFFALGACLNLLRAWASERFQWSLRRHWVLRLMRHFLEMPFLEFRSRRLGGLVDTLATETHLGAQAIWELMEGVARLTFFFVLAAVFFLTDWRAASAVTLFAVLLAVAARPVMVRRSAALGRRRITLNQQWKSAATENLMGFREIKILGKEKEATEALRPDLVGLSRTASALRLVRSAPTAFSTVAFVTLALTLFLTMETVSAPEAGAVLPMVGFAVILARRMMILIAGVVGHITSFRGLLPSTAFVIDNVLTEPEGPADDRDLHAPVFPSAATPISFDDVSFAYPGKAPILRGVSFSLPTGRISVLQGRSGSGKSTIADLLLGLIRPTSGQVTVGDRALNRIDLKTWRASVGYVSQESFFFNASVRENLRAARAEATDEDMMQACRTAGATAFLERLPQGLDTVLGERGFEASGGEKQRLALARALLRRPPLLVLDEVTSAVDPETAEGIWRRLSDLGPETTVLVLSHGAPKGLMGARLLHLEDGQVSLHSEREATDADPTQVTAADLDRIPVPTERP